MGGFNETAFFDNNHFNSDTILPARYDWIAGIGAEKILQATDGFLKAAEKVLEEKKDWWFGFLGYDLKNEIEDLSSGHPDFTSFPQAFLFRPQVVIFCRGLSVTISVSRTASGLPGGPQDIFSVIEQFSVYDIHAFPPLVFTPRMTKTNYLEKVSGIANHIQRGDIYEINFCQEFYSDNAVVDPASVFIMLRQQVPAPFAAFIRIGNRYIMGASPERFLRKEANRIFTQPMKGTAPRGRSGEEDEMLKAALRASEKETAENVMIVDLARNDLSRFATRGSVKVDELFGLYTFPKVHQLVSTISCETAHGLSFIKIIKSTFPMGSMTGAPKIRAMQLIEQFENSRRGSFSGTAGYIEPNGDFDMHVMIRSFIYHAGAKYLSIMSGSAITVSSDPEKEYEECLLKAGYAIEAIGGKIVF
jgi:para-aminobenzoate synthetase component 1